MKIILSLAAACAIAAPTLAQPSNISSTNKHAWGENIGWTNWRDANGGSQGAIIGLRFAQGFVWGENVGWINLDSADLGKHVALGCPADFNNDGQVNGADLATLLANWLAPGGLPDLNGDGTVNGADLANLLANWGPC